jgi:hypothetical protein
MQADCRKKPQTSGEFITAARDIWHERRTSGFVWLAAKAPRVEFRGSQRFVFSKRELNYLLF